MNKFEQLQLPKEMIESISQKGFKHPTQIQEKTIPHILAGKDVIGISATGTGKTLCFAAGVISDVKKHQGIQGLILAPTRELAKQIYEELTSLLKLSKLDVALLVGGPSLESDKNKISRSEIIVGTPGRITDHIEKGSLQLDAVNVLVLDEADILIKGEFLEQTSQIIQACKEERQDLLFTATLSQELEKLAKTYMKDPVSIRAKTKEVEKAKLIQNYYLVENNQKISLLIHFLDNLPSGLNIVFTNRSETAKILLKNIKKHTTLKAETLHSDISEGKRKKTLQNFKDHKFDVLVATDIASRGLDVEGVTHIYNYAIPSEAKRYIHRIGRTARAGAQGTVINFISKNDDNKFKEIIEEFKIKAIEKEIPQHKELKNIKSLK